MPALRKHPPRIRKSPPRSAPLPTIQPAPPVAKKDRNWLQRSLDSLARRWLFGHGT